MIEGAYVQDLRAALTRADFTVDAVFALLGEDAHRALGRNQTVPARRATSGSGDLATLVRLFALQVPVDRGRADAALPGLVEPLVAAGMLEASGGEVRALVDIRPYGDEAHDWWIVCDPTPGLDGRQAPMNSEYVLGISEASSSLAQLTIREPAGRALDLGTGCGVQALHLAQHAGHVVATDVNPRALAMARLTAQLNGLDIDVRDGSLFDPVAGETFDLIATNPPFVISPPGSEVLVYRDSGMPGDSVVRHLVENAASHLNDGGWCQILANWAHRGDTAWQDGLEEWFAGQPLDAWVVQRELVDPSEYVEMWLADAGLASASDYVRRYDAWLDWFAEVGIEAVGFGWLSMRKTAADAGAPLRGVDRRGGSADRTGRRRVGPAHRSVARARRRRAARSCLPAGAGPGRGDPRAGRRRAPGVDRAAPPARRTPIAPGRHDRGGTGQRQRGRPDGGADPRRPRLTAGPGRRGPPAYVCRLGA